MLTYFLDGKEYPIAQDDYFITEQLSGPDELEFSIPVTDPLYASLQEEGRIRDRDQQFYNIKSIDAGSNSATVTCEQDLDDWKSELKLNFSSDTKTCAQTIEMVKPSGWTVEDIAAKSIQRTISGNLTPYEIVWKCPETFGVYLRFDNAKKTVRILPQEQTAPVGSFATRELNLKEINYKGSTKDFATVLYAYGKDGLSFADINNGKAYVTDFSYSSKVVIAYWSDERYTVAADLLEAAKVRVASMAKPVRSYECSIYDLKAVDPEKYNNLDFSLLTTVMLIDDNRGQFINYQVVARKVYPYYPENNEITLSSDPITISDKMTSIVEDTVTDTSSTSTIAALRATEISHATDWLTNGKGYKVERKDSAGNTVDTLYMDTPDIATAKNVLRIGQSGIGFSTSGANGPYVSAWTIGGHFNADFIDTGNLVASIIKAGILSDAKGRNSWNMETGELNLNIASTIGGKGIASTDEVAKASDAANSAASAATDAKAAASAAQFDASSAKTAADSAQSAADAAKSTADSAQSAADTAKSAADAAADAASTAQSGVSALYTNILLDGEGMHLAKVKEVDGKRVIDPNCKYQTLVSENGMRVTETSNGEVTLKAEGDTVEAANLVSRETLSVNADGYKLRWMKFHSSVDNEDGIGAYWSKT